VTTPDVKLKSFTNSALYSGKTEMRMGLKNNYLIGSGGETQTLNIRTLTPLILVRIQVPQPRTFQISARRFRVGIYFARVQLSTQLNPSDFTSS
jgi:hypothetical protein